MDIINDIIRQKALRLVGIYEVGGNNKGFSDKDFEKKITNAGWQVGWPYCVLTAEVIWKEAYEKYTDVLRWLDKLFSANAVQNFENFKSDSRFSTGFMPEIGSIATWQKYENDIPTSKGHAGIVTAINHNSLYFETVEGNTSPGGGREGDGIYIKKRELKFTPKKNGLVLLGFIHPFINQV